MSFSRGSLLLLFLGGLLLFPGQASGQVLDDVTRYSNRLPVAGGARAGMAGAGLYVGVGDPSTLFGNPAGLGWLSGSAIGVDFAVQRARSNARFLTPTETTSSDRTVSDYQLGSLSGAYSFPADRGSLVVGVSLHQADTYERGFDVAGANRSNSITSAFLSPYGFDGEDIVFDDPRSALAYDAGAIDFSGNPVITPAVDFDTSAVNGQMQIRQQENIRESGQLNELATGLAVEVAPGIMLGGGINIQFGRYLFERFYRETDVSGLLPPEDPENSQPPYDPYFIETTNLEGFREVQLEERIDTEISGVNLRFGLSGQVTSGLRGGIHIESPTWYNLTDIYGTEIRTDFDCDFSSAGPSCPEGGVLGFESGNLTENEFDYEIRTPWRIGAGLQYARAGLTVAGDVEMVDWTQARVSSDDASFTALNRRIDNLNSTFNSRVGAEYAFEKAALRAGVAYQPDPRDLEFPDIDGQSTNLDRLFLSAGASYTPDNQFTLHLNWLQKRFDDQFASYSNGPLVRERVARNQFQIGITYRPQ